MFVYSACAIYGFDGVVWCSLGGMFVFRGGVDNLRSLPNGEVALHWSGRELLSLNRLGMW